MARLQSHPVTDGSDIRAFFDALAGTYREAHGDARALLEYRLALIDRLLAPDRREILLEIGCGPGVHLFPLAASYGRAIGVDLAPGMIAAAEIARRTRPCAARIELYAEAAEQLASIADASTDAVLCVGAFEHMPAKAAVLREVHRVLKPGGKFVCLTPNGDYLWYRWIAPQVGYEVRHLSSDRYVNLAEMRELLESARLRLAVSGYWRFVAKGDMPWWIAPALGCLDRLGVVFNCPSLRGGLYVCARRL